MTGTIKKTTINYNFTIPAFDSPQWGRYIEANFDTIDALIFAATNVGGVSGNWSNSFPYIIGERVVDIDDSFIRECLVPHTSASTGTFAADRASNPTYWKTVQTDTLGVQLVDLAPTADQNDYDTTVLGSVTSHAIIRLAPTNSIIITGIDTTDFDVGKQITIQNASENSLGQNGRLIILEAKSASSLSTNRFNVHSYSKPILLAPNQSLTFYYDGVNLNALSENVTDLNRNFDHIVGPNFLPTTTISGGSVTAGALVEDQGNEELTALYLETGGTSSGYAAVGDKLSSLSLGSGDILLYNVIQLDQALDLTNDYRLLIGAGNTLNTGAIGSTFIGWVMETQTSSVFHAITRALSVSTDTSTGFFIVPGDTMCLGIYINSDKMRVDFFYSLDLSTWHFLAPHTTNIPFSPIRHGIALRKTSGTSARGISVMTYAKNKRSV